MVPLRPKPVGAGLLVTNRLPSSPDACGHQYGEQKANLLQSKPMPVRSCQVTIQDMDGVSHTVEVTATTLYDAVAQGLAAIQGQEWAAGIAQGLNVVKVSVAHVRVEHEVKLIDFKKWLERTSGSPREMSDRHRIRAILGIPVAH